MIGLQPAVMQQSESAKKLDKFDQKSRLYKHIKSRLHQPTKQSLSSKRDKYRKEAYMYPKAENKLFHVSTSRTRKKREFNIEELDSKRFMAEKHEPRHQNVNSQPAIQLFDT